MNILILSNVSFGLYFFRAELIERLCRDNFVSIIAEDGGGKEGKRRELEAIGAKFIDFSVNRRGVNPFQDVRLLRFYKKKIKELKPDVVLTYTIKPNVYGGMACAALGVPYIANVTGLGTALENDGILQKICLILYKRGLHKAKKVFFQNQDNLDFLLRHKVVRDNYDLLPGSGVNLQRYIPSEYPKGETVDFVFVGRIMKAKGIEEYFEAARYLRQKYSQTRFHVYGYLEQSYQKVVEQLHKENVIDYCGVVDDIPSVYRAAHCVVLPSYHEGMPNVLLEASASARPIISTDRSGCRDVVVDGFNGFSVKAEDSKDLIRALENFLSLSVEEKIQFGLNARKRVEEKFDREFVIRKYLDEISEIKLFL